MIPISSNIFLNGDFEVREASTKTHKLSFRRNCVRGYTDNLSAMEQAVYKILNTERYNHVIYSWNYGIELNDLYGEPVSYVCPELERRISEALLNDTRIKKVENFKFNILRKGEIFVTFDVHTIFGNIVSEKTVNI